MPNICLKLNRSLQRHTRNPRDSTLILHELKILSRLESGRVIVFKTAIRAESQIAPELTIYKWRKRRRRAKRPVQPKIAFHDINLIYKELTFHPSQFYVKFSSLLLLGFLVNFEYYRINIYTNCSHCDYIKRRTHMTV